MWKSGWNLDKEWVKRNEKWLILLVLGLAILILYAPFGKKTSETGVLRSGERWAESETETLGIEQGRTKMEVQKRVVRMSKQVCQALHPSRTRTASTSFAWSSGSGTF